MIEALICGKLIRQPELKTGQNNSQYCNFLMAVHVGEPENIVVSGMAFGGLAERVAKLEKGDALAVVGALKPTEWQDKATGETRHGLGVTVAEVVTPYDIKKKRKPETPENSARQGTYTPSPPYNAGKPHQRPFDDPIEF